MYSSTTKNWFQTHPLFTRSWDIGHCSGRLPIIPTLVLTVWPDSHPQHCRIPRVTAKTWAPPLQRGAMFENSLVSTWGRSQKLVRDEVVKRLIAWEKLLDSGVEGGKREFAAAQWNYKSNRFLVIVEATGSSRGHLGGIFLGKMRPFRWFTAIAPPFWNRCWVSQWRVPITKPLKSYQCSSWVLSGKTTGWNCKHVKKRCFMVQSGQSYCEPEKWWMLHVNGINKKGIIQPFSIAFPCLRFLSKRQKAILKSHGCKMLLKRHYYPNLDPLAVALLDLEGWEFDMGEFMSTSASDHL